MKPLKDMMGNVLEPGDWYIAIDDIHGWFIYELTAQPNLTLVVESHNPRVLKGYRFVVAYHTNWAIKYPKNLGTSLEAIRAYRALLGWENS